MPMNHDIRIKVTSKQFEEIKTNAESLGHKTISSYIRKKLLSEDQIDVMLHKIFEILNKKK